MNEENDAEEVVEQDPLVDLEDTYNLFQKKLLDNFSSIHLDRIDKVEALYLLSNKLFSRFNLSLGALNAVMKAMCANKDALMKAAKDVKCS